MIAKNVNFKHFIEEDYCNTLGNDYHPYAWLEEMCDEMTEDHLGLL